MLKKWKQNLKAIFLIWSKKNLSNDETKVNKPANKWRTVMTLSTYYYESMMMQHLLD